MGLVVACRIIGNELESIHLISQAGNSVSLNLDVSGPFLQVAKPPKTRSYTEPMLKRREACQSSGGLKFLLMPLSSFMCFALGKGGEFQF